MNASYCSSAAYYQQMTCPYYENYLESYPFPSPSTCYHSYGIDPISPQFATYDSSLDTVQLMSQGKFNQSSAQRRRRPRTIFSKEQVYLLDRIFEKNPYPDIQLREELSEKLDVHEARIQVWFKNRRSRARLSNKSK